MSAWGSPSPRPARVALCLAALWLSVASCRTPTSVTLVLSTDVDCDDAPTTSVTVSRQSDETLAPELVTQVCQPDGHIGTLVVVPAADRDEDLRVRVVTSIGDASCVAPSYGAGCIVSRRQLRFIAHSELTMPIAQQADCVGVACDASTTCRKGACVVAVVDQDRCQTNPAQCGVEIAPEPPDGAGGAAGAGGASGAGGVSGGSGGAPLVATGPVVAAGQYHTCALRSQEVFCWGANESGQLGLGDTAARRVPVRVSGPSLIALHAGYGWTMGRDTAGAMHAWGHNHRGQLAVGDTTDRLVPTASLLGPTRDVGAGYDHGCAVDTQGALLCWGDNVEAQLGQGNPSALPISPSPVAVGQDRDWTQVTAGQGHTCGLRAGALRCWGRNTNAETGIGTLDPVQVWDLRQAGTDTTWTSLDAGQDSNCALRADRSLWCWGDRNDGTDGSSVVLTSPTAEPLLSPTAIDAGEFVQVSIDVFHGCGVRPDGTLWCWGRNVEGQLGVGDYVNRAAVTRAGTESDWQSVSVGRTHTCASKRSGAIYCTGKNDFGQCGVGDTERINTLTAVLP